jgi:hypothetical protein
VLGVVPLRTGISFELADPLVDQLKHIVWIVAFTGWREHSELES